MTLLQLAEPIFLQVCQMNRLGRVGGRARRERAEETSPARQEEFDAAREKIRELFARYQKESEEPSKLARRAARVKMPLLYFVDYSLAYSSLPYAEMWRERRLAVEGLTEDDKPDLAGDSKFFTYLDEMLDDAKSERAETAEDAKECLTVMYACLGLGFLGQHHLQSVNDRTREIKSHMEKIWRVVKPQLDRFDKTLCKDAVDTVKVVDFTKPVARRVLPFAVAFAVFCLGAYVLYCGMYAAASDGLSKTLAAIAKR